MYNTLFLTKNNIYFLFIQIFLEVSQESFKIPSSGHNYFVLLELFFLLTVITWSLWRRSVLFPFCLPYVLHLVAFPLTPYFLVFPLVLSAASSSS